MKKLAIGLFMVLTVFSQLQAQKKNPSLLLQKGQTISYQVTANIDMTQSMMGQELQSQINSSSNAVFSVDDIQMDQYLINQKLKDVKTHLKMQEMDTTFRLAEQGGFPTLLVNKAGKVVARHKNNKENTIGGFSPDMAGNASFLPFVEFPDYTVKNGESWSTDYTDTTDFSGGSLVNKVKTTYTLMGKEEKDGKKCLKITYRGIVENEGLTSMQGMEFYIEGSGAITGTQWIDVKSGILIADEAAMENQMSLSLSGQQNFIIPMSMKTKITKQLQ